MKGPKIEPLMPRSDSATDRVVAQPNAANALAAAIVAAMFAAMCAFSWLKWADVFVDFGNELYLAWRISEGEHLTRDIAYRHGPLSHYWNALWFAAFDPSIRTLSRVNLLLFAITCTAVFRIVSRARGAFAAGVSGVVLVGVFGFGQYVPIGNYNYVTPYQHAQTHGLLLGVLMITSLGAAASATGSAQKRLALAGAGVCLGLVFLTKLELFVPIAATAAIGLMALVRTRAGDALGVGGFFAAAAGSVAAFFAFLSLHMSAGDAGTALLGNWTHLGAGGSVLADPFYGVGAGLDDVAGHSARMFGAAICVAGFAALLLALDRFVVQRRTGVASVIALVFVLTGISGLIVDWTFVARGLPLLSGAAAVWWCGRLFRNPDGPSEALSRELPLALFSVLGVLLLGKMLLAARFEQYGFVLAMPAALTLCVALVADLPSRLPAPGGGVARVGATAAIAGWLAFCLTVSNLYYARKTLPIGSGGDLVLASPERAQPIAQALRQMDAQLPRTASLLVMPEGASLNYWLKRANPTPYTLFLPAEVDAFGGEQHILEGIRSSPPDFIALVNRSGDEFGVGPFGSDPRFGGGLLEYVESSYRRVGRFGAEPFRQVRPGVVVMQRRSSAR